MPRLWCVGDACLVRWRGLDEWHPARIKKILEPEAHTNETFYYDVIYVDNSVEKEVWPGLICEPPSHGQLSGVGSVAVGSRVEALWNDNNWYAARIQRVNAEIGAAAATSYDLLYENGGALESAVPAALVRMLHEGRRGQPSRKGSAKIGDSSGSSSSGAARARPVHKRYQCPICKACLSRKGIWLAHLRNKNIHPALTDEDLLCFRLSADQHQLPAADATQNELEALFDSYLTDGSGAAGSPDTAAAEDAASVASSPGGTRLGEADAARVPAPNAYRGRAPAPAPVPAPAPAGQRPGQASTPTRPGRSTHPGVARDLAHFKVSRYRGLDMLLKNLNGR